MQPTPQDVADAVGKEAGDELESAAGRIKHCLAQLQDEQIWRRPTPSMNSIANLILHVCGNVGQWINAGIGGGEDKRDRPKEFSAQNSVSRDDLLGHLDTTLTQAKATLVNASPADLLEKRRIQGFDVTGMQAVFESVAHFRGHTQEIVHIARCQLGDDYEFAFVPSTPEQGAPPH